MGVPPVASQTVPTIVPASLQRKPWVLPGRGLTVFYGCPETPRLSHYFLPRLLLSHKLVLFLDGANCFSPLRIARFARERHLPQEQFYERIRVARAFTCFQLEELIARVPRVLHSFPAQVLVVTGLPDLFYDEDVSDFEAGAAYRKALDAIARLVHQPLCIAVFSDGFRFTPKPARSRFFPQLTQRATQVWRFSLNEDDALNLVCERSMSELTS